MKARLLVFADALLLLNALLLLAHPSFPANSVRELVAMAKAQPGKLAFASGGNGTILQMQGELLQQQTGARFIHVPYKGVAEQMLAVASGQVMVGVGSNGFAPYVESGRVRLLATLAVNPEAASAKPPFRPSAISR